MKCFPSSHQTLCNLGHAVRTMILDSVHQGLLNMGTMTCIQFLKLPNPTNNFVPLLLRTLIDLILLFPLHKHHPIISRTHSPPVSTKSSIFIPVHTLCPLFPMVKDRMVWMNKEGYLQVILIQTISMVCG